MSEIRSQPQASAQPGPGKPWPVDVDVHLTAVGPPAVFDIHSSLPKNGQALVFNNNHRPGFTVNFHLIDKTNSGYVFPPQPMVQQACWSQRGTSCPTSGIWDVFDPRRVANQGMTLEVYNDNPSPAIGDFKYTLRVTNDGGATYLDLDPSGQDMNGPRS